MMYLGGKCTRCGNDDISVLEFHHKKDSNKKFDIGGKINKSWYIIKKEIDKCILLCANCHLKEHRQNLTPEFLEVMFDYHGTTKINEVAELLHTYESKLSVPHKDMR